MKFKIEIENFEGPIDALLQLIEKRKMPISDISLADICDDYIHFIKSLDSESLSNMTHFIFVASTLTLIKSKSLLPHLDLTEDEEGDIDDLKRRIELFKVFGEAAQSLKKSFNGKHSFYYPKTRKREIIFTPHEGLNKNQMIESLNSIFADQPVKEDPKKEASIRIAIHIEDMMDSLESRIKKVLKTNFSSFVSNQIGNRKESKAIKVYKVVGFLAMLELVKNGILDVLQNGNFQTISLESINQIEEK